VDIFARIKITTYFELYFPLRAFLKALISLEVPSLSNRLASPQCSLF